MISLTGSAPTLGFLGNLSVVNNLVMEGNYYLVALVLLTLTLIANGYLRIIKSIYLIEQIEEYICFCLLILSLWLSRFCPPDC